MPARLRRPLLVALAAVLLAAVTGTAVGTAAEPAHRTDSGSTFTIAVIPDTQNEVVYNVPPLPDTASKFLTRTRWLAANRHRLNLAYVTHTGDVVNWQTPNEDQYQRAFTASLPLSIAHIPFSFSIGNHDSAATCPGGSACPGDTHAHQRDTRTFNRFFPWWRSQDLRGMYEFGKVDNSYSTFSAGHRNWLILNLELWPRTGVIEWARRVVASHPTYNVAVVTHSFLTATNTIEPTNGGYGDNSPQYLYDHLISQYANIRFVFSGHTGLFGYRQDTGVHGNKIYEIMSTYHDTPTATRLVRIDTAHDSFTARVHQVQPDADLTDGSAVSVTGANWVRP